MRFLRRIHYNSPVVLTFVLISLLVLIIDEVSGGQTTARLFCVYRSSLADPLTYPRFFLHVLGHAGYEHYMGNVLLMLVVGPPLEEKYGSKTLAVTIIITAFISGVVQWAAFPGQALLGASGIVFMMIVMSSLAGMRAGAIPLTLIFVLVFYVGGEVMDGILKTDNISQLTHVIGGVCGAFLGYALSKRRIEY